MLDQIFKGEVPSIFETTIKRESGKATASSKSPSPVNYRNEDDFLRGLTATLCYCGSFLTLGMAAAVIGPTLLELGCVTHLKLRGVSWVFFAQGLAALLGSSFGGFLADRYDCSIILLECVFSVALCLTIIPVCTVFPIMLTFFALLGVHMGVIDTVANSVLIRIHGKKVAPRLQTLHFCYGLGALLSPVIAGPFLRDRCQGGHFQTNIFGWTLENSTLLVNYLENKLEGMAKNSSSVDMKLDTVNPHTRDKSFVQFAYWIVASLQLPVLVSLSYIIYKQRQIRNFAPGLFSRDVVTLTDEPSRSSDGSKKELSQIFRPANEEETSTKSTIGSFPAKIVFITTLSAILLFMFDGLQGAYGGYLYTYAIKSDIHLATGKAALLNSLFWTLFAIGRFISIPIAMFVSPDKMLIANLSGCFVAMSFMLYLHDVPLSLWIGSCVFGAFMSSVFPSTLSFAENYLEVTGTITSILIVSSASGEMLIPVLVGKEFDIHGSMSFLFVGFTVCVLALLTLIGLRIVARTPLKLTVSELFYWIIGFVCQCTATGGSCFRSDSCKYTEMIPCETATNNTESPVHTSTEESVPSGEIHG